MDEKNITQAQAAGLFTGQAPGEPSDSPDMQPYARLAVSVARGVDTKPNLLEIAQLPLEKRYVWRVASALKWGFAGFDDLNVTADRLTLTGHDLDEVMDSLRSRPAQLCIFLKTLVGTQEMKRIMIEAIAGAGRVGA